MVAPGILFQAMLQNCLRGFVTECWLLQRFVMKLFRKYSKYRKPKNLLPNWDGEIIGSGFVQLALKESGMILKLPPLGIEDK